MLQRLIANDLVSLDKSSLEDFPVAKSVDDTFVSTINELRKLVLRRFVWVWVKIGTS